MKKLQNMKNKTAVAVAFIAASGFSSGEIVINDFLSLEGYIDTSYSHTDRKVGSDGESDNSYGIDGVELAWLFDFDSVTAQVAVEYGRDLDNVEVEEAFFTYHMGGGGAITAGRFASMLGFEDYDPVGLYQYSFAYVASEDFDGFSSFSRSTAAGFANIEDLFFPIYDQGVKYTYEDEGSFWGISLIDSASQGRLGGAQAGQDSESGFGLEIAGALDLGHGLSWFGGLRYTDVDSEVRIVPGSTGRLDSQYLLNTYITYETGAWLFAGELNYREADYRRIDDHEAFSGLIMANLAYEENASLTGRFSFVNGNQSGNDEDFFKYTLAHGYAFSDNLLLVNEVSFVDGEVRDGSDYEALIFAAEFTFSF